MGSALAGGGIGTREMKEEGDGLENAYGTSWDGLRLYTLHEKSSLEIVSRLK